jgi:hypothetical protein
MSASTNVHRREFARQCLGTLGAASALAATAAAQDKSEKGEAPAEKTPPVELLLLSTLVQNYPSEHYTEEAIAGIYRDIAGDVARGKPLRAFPLANGDGPATVFRVFRANEQGTP